jgi:NAD-dependent SIR2 family protein deacetylase
MNSLDVLRYDEEEDEEEEEEGEEATDERNTAAAAATTTTTTTKTTTNDDDDALKTQQMQMDYSKIVMSNRERERMRNQSSMKKRERRERVERLIKNALSKPYKERDVGELRLLEENEEKTRMMLDQMEKSLRRKARADEKAEEREDSEQDVMDGVAVTVRLIKESGGFVLHTGAGISTAAKIPDFRGKNGVWTKQRKGEVVEMPKFENTRPTKAHLACKALFDAGLLKYVITQNVDGLHQRSGIADDFVAELHGSVYKEKCPKCCSVYVRDFDVTSTKPSHGKNRHKTGRFCDRCPDNNQALKDTIVQFGESLDDETLFNAREWSQEAKMSIVVGTSLRVPPASSLPRMAKNHCVIVNLQWTSQDSKATLKLHAKADDFLVQIAKHFGLDIPNYDPMLDDIGRKVVFNGESFADEKRQHTTPMMEDVEEKMKILPGTNARILFGEADGGKKLSKSAREALDREEKRRIDEREGNSNNNHSNNTQKNKKKRKKSSSSLTMKRSAKMPCFPRPGARETPLTNNHTPIFDISKITKKKRTPVVFSKVTTENNKEITMKKVTPVASVASKKNAVVKKEGTKEKTVVVVKRGKSPPPPPSSPPLPSDDEIARMLFAEINGMRSRRR